MIREKSPRVRFRILMQALRMSGCCKFRFLTSIGDIVVVDRGLDGLESSSDVELLDVLVQVLDCWVSDIIGAKDQGRLLDLVGSVNVLDRQNGDRRVVAGIAEGDTLARLQGKTIDILLRDIQVDRDGPQGTVRKTKIFDNAVGRRSMWLTSGTDMCCSLHSRVKKKR